MRGGGRRRRHCYLLDELIQEQLSDESGIDELIKILDKHLGKDELSDAFDKYIDFEKYSRTSETVTEFIAEFDNKYQKLVKQKIELPEEILAFKLLISDTNWVQ